MFLAFQHFKPREAVPRMLVDFAIVHLSMILALAVCVVLHTASGDQRLTGIVIGNVKRYYAVFVAALAWLFPAVFLVNGFYTKSRAYASPYKALVLLRGIGMSILIFLTVNYLVFRRELVPRSVAVTFCILLMTLLIAVRYAKALVIENFEIIPKNGPAKQPAAGAVLVVGGAGYIGSILVRKLLESGRRVRVLDNLVYGDGALADLKGHPGLELLAGDCRNIQSVVSAVKGVDSIVHLAAIVGDPACEQDRQTALEINYAATRMLIEVAKGNGVSRFIFASSCSVYGRTDLLVDEEFPVHPISLYGQTKVDSEAALLNARTALFQPVILRFATVFGHSYRPRFDLVVNLLVAKAFKERTIVIRNAGQWRPFIHVRDAAQGICSVLNAPLSLVSGQIFNLGDSSLNHTLGEIAHNIGRFFPDTRVEYVENADRRNYRVSFNKIKNQLGFRCALRIEDGILELRNSFEQGSIGDYTNLHYDNQKFLKTSGSPVSADVTDTYVMAAFAKPR
jgi:nucleoside-diphosphate-sugar epimerase